MDKAELLDYAIVTLGVPLIAALARGIQLLMAWATAKTKTTIDDRLAAKFQDFAVVAAKATYQAYVKPLKDNGEWTPEKHAEAKQLALAEIKKYSGTKLLKEAAGAFGGDLEAFLLGLIESTVHDNKRSGEVAKALAATRYEGPLT